MAWKGLPAAAALAAVLVSPSPGWGKQGSAEWPGRGQQSYTTSNGCLAALPTSTVPVQSVSWSGSCSSGDRIEGSGTLSVRLADSDGGFFDASITGRLVDGRFDGTVEMAVVVDGQTLSPRSFEFDRGCMVGDDSCAPGAGVSADEDDGPTGYPTPAVTSGPNGPLTGPDKIIPGTECVGAPTTTSTGGPTNVTYRITYANACQVEVTVFAREANTGREVSHPIAPYQSHTFECSSGPDNTGCTGHNGFFYQHQ